MSRFPTVYGHCDAGCRRQVVPYDQWKESASHIRQFANEDGKYHLAYDGESRYRIFAGRKIIAEGDRQFDCSMCLRLTAIHWDEDGNPTPTDTFVDYVLEWTNDDYYARYFDFELLSWSINDNGVITAIYDAGGKRYTRDVGTFSGTISQELGYMASVVVNARSETVNGAYDVLLFNEDATVVIVPDLTGYATEDFVKRYIDEEIINVLNTEVEV